MRHPACRVTSRPRRLRRPGNLWEKANADRPWNSFSFVRGTKRIVLRGACRVGGKKREVRSQKSGDRSQGDRESDALTPPAACRLLLPHWQLATVNYSTPTNLPCRCR